MKHLALEAYSYFKKLRVLQPLKPVWHWMFRVCDALETLAIKSLNAMVRKSGLNILVIDEFIPDPSLGAGMPRTRKFLLDLATFDAKVTFIPIDPATHERTVQELERQGIEVFHGSFDFIGTLKKRRGFYDVIIISRWHLAEGIIGTIRELFPKAHLIFDTEAITFQREFDREMFTGEPVTPDLKAREFAVIKKADTIIVVSEAERKLVQQVSSKKRVIVYSHPVVVKTDLPGYDTRKNLLFIGRLSEDNSPNVDALNIFLRESWPEINRQLPDCKMLVVGANPCKRIQDAAGPGVQLLGRVEDLQEIYNSARVFIVPLRYGAGIPLKLAEAMGMGLPTVASPVAARGYELEDGSVVPIAHDSKAFVPEVVKLYTDKKFWEKRQQSCLEFAKKHFDPEEVVKELQELLLNLSRSVH